MNGGTKTRGFTLLEILVVVAVMGILISLAGLSVGNTVDSQRVDRSAERLLKVVALAEKRAVLSGKPIGISFSHTGYYLTEYVNAWHPLDNNFRFTSHELETGVVVEYDAAFLDANENSPAVFCSNEKPAYIEVPSIANATNTSSRVNPWLRYCLILVRLPRCARLVGRHH